MISFSNDIFQIVKSTFKRIMYSFLSLFLFFMILLNPVYGSLVETDKGQTVLKNLAYDKLCPASLTHQQDQGKSHQYALEPIFLLLLDKKDSHGEDDFFVADYSMEDLPISDKFSDQIDLGLLDHSDIDEASGIIISRQNPDMFWTHNDNGDFNRIFLVHKNGAWKGTFLLKGAINRDWEDIAAGPGPMENVNYLFVGDIGDNTATQKYKHIYRFPEPDINKADTSVNWVELGNVEKITFVYPDGIVMDSETLLVDPWTKDIYLVTKMEKPVTIYRLRFPQSTMDTVVAEKYGTLPFTYAVAGDISADGKEILIKTYDAVYLWTRNNGESMRDAFIRPPFRLKYMPEPQGEAIAFALDSTGFYTLSEILYGVLPRIYFYKRKE